MCFEHPDPDPNPDQRQTPSPNCTLIPTFNPAPTLVPDSHTRSSSFTARPDVLAPDCGLNLLLPKAAPLGAAPLPVPLPPLALAPLLLLLARAPERCRRALWLKFNISSLSSRYVRD